MTFATLGLAEPLVRALEAKGYTEPTPIQRDSIPQLLEGRDLLGIAQTGTGKTAAFVLPSIQRLSAGKKVLPTHCRMLVLAPTRELASQIADSARAYGQFSKMSACCHSPVHSLQLVEDRVVLLLCRRCLLVEASKTVHRREQ